MDYIGSVGPRTDKLSYQPSQGSGATHATPTRTHVTPINHPATAHKGEHVRKESRPTAPHGRRPTGRERNSRQLQTAGSKPGKPDRTLDINNDVKMKAKVCRHPHPRFGRPIRIYRDLWARTKTTPNGPKTHAHHLYPAIRPKSIVNGKRYYTLSM